MGVLTRVEQIKGDNPETQDQGLDEILALSRPIANLTQFPHSSGAVRVGILNTVQGRSPLVD